MSRHVLRRLAGALPLLLLISLLLFLLIHLPPGGPADIYAADPSASPEAIARMHELWGLNDPLPVQYGRWLWNLVSGEWGYSFRERRPAQEVVLERLPNTLLLTGSALGISLVVGLALGIAGATARRAWVRQGIQVLAVLGMSVPTFWSGTLVILVFSVYLGWIPAGGMYTIGAPFSIGDRLLHLIAPAMVLGSVYVAQWTRYLQASLAEALREDYIRTARAKGVGSVGVVVRHALPNALLPFVTVLGLELPRLLSGAMVTEVVFAWPGLGRLLTGSLLSRDYPVVMALLVILAVAVVLTNVMTDVLYAWIDPRIRYE